MAASNVGIFEDNLLTLYGLLFENWIKREGSFEFSVLRFWLLFRSVLVFIAVWGYTVLKHLLSVFPKIANGFSDLVSDVIFDFSYFGSGSSSIWAATMILNSRETSACFTCHRNVKIYRFWWLCMQFSVVNQFFCGFAVLDDFFYGLASSNRPQCPPLFSIWSKYPFKRK